MRIVSRWWLLFAAIVALVSITACGSPYKYKTLPAPSLRNTPEKPPKPSCPHVMGGCLPQPKSQSPTETAPPLKQTTPKPARDTAFVSFTTRASGAITGPDLSNNDPVSCSGIGAIAARSRFLYLKSIEGIGFFDRTAQGMGSCAKARRLPVGGYDFLHVAQASASSEAAFFVRALRAQGLLGKGTLPPAGDAEYPLGGLSSSGRVWLQTWVDTVYSLDGHICPIMYTGAWWWQPHIGSFWPTCENKQLLSWISGYHVRFPFMPSGVSHLDFWQFADDGFNGATNADLSAWMHDGASFARFAGGPIGVVAKPKPKPIRWSSAEVQFSHDGTHSVTLKRGRWSISKGSRVRAEPFNSKPLGR